MVCLKSTKYTPAHVYIHCVHEYCCPIITIHAQLKLRSVIISPSSFSSDPAMAEPPAQPTSPYHPEPRHDAPTFSMGSKLYMIRGMLKSFQHKTTVTIPREVEVFDGALLSWKRISSIGELPPWHGGAAVTTFQDEALFLNGDCGQPGFCKELFAFNSINFAWKRRVSTGQMLPTARSCLTSLPNGHLVTIGGNAEHPTDQSMRGFIPIPGDSKGRGWTNQLLYYNSESGVCMDCQYLYSTSHAVHVVKTGPLHV